jgi:hypothetical protein
MSLAQARRGARAASRRRTARVLDPALDRFRAGQSAADADTGTLDVIPVGDSVVEGRSLAAAADRWASKLLTRLRNRWQTAGVAGGEGYVPGFYVSPEPADRWTYAGTLTFGVQYGIGMRAVHMPSAADSKMTATVTCTRFDIRYSANNNTGSFTVSIDGGAGTTVATGIASTTTTGGFVWTSPALAAGSHTITITNTSGKTVLIEGAAVYDGDESVGVRLWEGGHSGWECEDYANRSTADAHAQSVAGFLPHLVIPALGYNDIANGRTAAQFETDLGVLVDRLRAPASTDPSILILGYPRRQDVTVAAWDAYLTAMQNVATAKTCAFLSLRDEPVTFTADGVHPDANGHTVIADAVDKYLASQAA